MYIRCIYNEENVVNEIKFINLKIEAGISNVPIVRKISLSPFNLSCSLIKACFQFESNLKTF